MNDKHSQSSARKFLVRWANMYSLLRTVPNDNRFDMTRWGYENDESVCGTSACAAGHAALHPWFRKRGFKPQLFEQEWYWREGGKSSWLGSMEIDPTEFFGAYGVTPFFPPYCRDILGHSRELGGNSASYRLTPKRVARAVRKYMLLTWTNQEVDDAIAQAEAEYDVNAVHRNTPWNSKRLARELQWAETPEESID